MARALISTQLGRTGDLHRAVEDVAAMESAGLDMVWVGEANGNDAVSVLGVLAARTSRVALGPGVLSVFTRTPALIAQTAATLDQLSHGRAVLGLGSSGPQVVEGWHGVAFEAPVTRTREVIDVCRLVWQGEPLAYDGRTVRLPLSPGRGTGVGKVLRLDTRPLRRAIPVYVASLGPANVSMTAELADGWLPHMFWSERAAEVWDEPLAAGRTRRDPSLGPLDVVAGGAVAIGPDADRHREGARTAVARFVGGMGARGRNFYYDLACRYGFTTEAEAIQNHFLGGDRAAAAAAVPDPLLDSLTMCGTESFVRGRVEAALAAGVTNLVVNPVGPEPQRVVETVRSWVDAA